MMADDIRTEKECIYTAYGFPQLKEKKVMFAEKPPPDITCKKCSSVAPEMCINSKKEVFCSNCLSKPVRKCPLEERVEVSLKIIKTHQCYVQCSFCKQDIEWIHGESHVLMCERRPSPCSHCNGNFEFKQLKNHEDECPEKCLVCSHCNESGIKRCKMEEHERNCNMKPPLSKFGIQGSSFQEFLEETNAELVALQGEYSELENPTAELQRTPEKFSNVIKTLKKTKDKLLDFQGEFLNLKNSSIELQRKIKEFLQVTHLFNL